MADIEYSCTACGRISDQRLCPEHRGGSELVTGGGSTRRWRTIRAYVIQRDPYCKLAIVCDGSAPSTHVDHIDDRQVGGEDDPTRLQGSCEPCHKAKHGGQTARLRRRHATTTPSSPPVRRNQEPLPPIIG